MAKRIASLAELRPQYDAVFCDVWGVLHNGVAVYRQAAAALSDFRAAGGRVVMITNSPRPAAGVLEQFGELGVPDGVCDVVVTSGDVTRQLIADAEGPVYHLGPGRDEPLYAGLDVERVSLSDATAIVCTGLENDEVDDPENYRDMLKGAAEHGLPFICANPDIVVERGDKLVWCAGALARLYAELGGETRLAGKPHAPIYALARQNAPGISDDRIVCIGDGMPTDVLGAKQAGLDLLYISGGIHAHDYTQDGEVDEQRLTAFLMEHEAAPKHWMQALA